MKKNTLFLSIALILPIFGGQVYAQTPSPTTSVVQTTVTTQQPQNVLRPAPTPSSPNAVNALQQTITTQTTQQPVQPQGGTVVQQASQTPGLVMPNFETTDESTLLREASRYQARLNFMTMMGKINKAQLDIEREKLKFETDKLKAEEDQKKLSSPQPSLGSASLGSIGGSVMGSGQGGVLDIAMEIEKPVIRSVYSYDGSFFAEVITNGSKTIAKSGSVLPNGDKVLSIREGVVVVSRRGKRMTLGVESSSSMGSSATASSSAAPRASSASSLPPLPPGGINP